MTPPTDAVRALKPWLRHLNACSDAYGCLCGLDDALAALAAVPSEDPAEFVVLDERVPKGWKVVWESWTEPPQSEDGHFTRYQQPRLVRADTPSEDPELPMLTEEEQMAASVPAVGEVPQDVEDALAEAAQYLNGDPPFDEAQLLTVAFDLLNLARRSVPAVGPGEVRVMLVLPRQDAAYFAETYGRWSGPNRDTHNALAVACADAIAPPAPLLEHVTEEDG